MRAYLDVFNDLARISLRVISEILRLSRCSSSLGFSRRLRFNSRLHICEFLSSGRFLFSFVHVAGDDRHALLSTLRRLAFRSSSSSAPKLFHDARHFTMNHCVRTGPIHLSQARLVALLAVGRECPEGVDMQYAMRIVSRSR